MLAQVSLSLVFVGATLPDVPLAPLFDDIPATDSVGGLRLEIAPLGPRHVRQVRDHGVKRRVRGERRRQVSGHEPNPLVQTHLGGVALQPCL